MSDKARILKELKACVSFQEYELCEEWGCLYPIPREHLINLHQKHLLHLLERGDHEKALQVSLQSSQFSLGRDAKVGRIGWLCSYWIPFRALTVSDLLLHELVIVTLPVSANSALGARWAAGSKILLIPGPVKVIICEAKGWWEKKMSAAKGLIQSE